MAFQPGAPPSTPVSVIELSISCRNLLKMDYLSKSYPMVVMFVRNSSSHNWTEFGRTEEIIDNQDPDFVKKFIIDYYFEERQFVKFEAYDIDSKTPRLSDHDFLGAAECTLGQIVSAVGNVLKMDLVKPGTSRGAIIVHAEEVSTCKEVATLQFRGYKLDKKDWFGKSDPYLVFSRCTEDNRFVVCHKTEVIKSTLNPEWKPFKIKVQKFCNGDYDRTIKVECFDWNSDGSADFIGEFLTNLRELSQGPGQKTSYELLNKTKKKGKEKSGMVFLMKYAVEVEPTFIDYVKGGCQLNCTIAIDFTASNGDPRDPRSLHYLASFTGGGGAGRGGSPDNQYVTALTAVGEIIQDYDSDKLFPALGFGAKLPPDGRISHEFFLNQHPENPYCEGIDGVLAAYLYSVQTVQLYGPTNFAPVINHVARFARSKQDGSQYHILLIITDGVITDMPQTKEAIVGASFLPMSIIIVGVGGAEFDAMEELDADVTPLCSHGRYADRDIVQFVPFRNFLTSQGVYQASSKERLAKEVLAEVPDQIVGWMRKRGLAPKPPPPDYMQAVNQFGASAAAAASAPGGAPPYTASAPPV